MTVHDSRILTGHNSPTGTEASSRAPPSSRQTSAPRAATAGSGGARAAWNVVAATRESRRLVEPGRDVIYAAGRCRGRGDGALQVVDDFYNCPDNFSDNFYRKINIFMEFCKTCDDETVREYGKYFERQWLHTYRLWAKAFRTCGKYGIDTTSHRRILPQLHQESRT